MQTVNLKKLRKIIFFLTFVTFIYQSYISVNLTDFICVFLVFFSMILTTNYCLNDNFFFKYPISLLLIFFSHFINLGGSLYLKTYELSIITEHLREPIQTIGNLVMFNFVVIISHFTYTKLKISKILQLKFRKLLIKFKLDDLHDLKFLYFLSFIAVLSKLFFYDFNTPIEFQINSSGPPLLGDIIYGFKFIIYLPIVIFFSKYLYKKKIHKSQSTSFIIYIIAMGIISISTNVRSILFDILTMSIMFSFLIFIFDEKSELLKKNILKFFIIIIFLFPSINFLENFSKNFVNERSSAKTNTPIENIYSFFNSENNFKNNNNKFSEKTFFYEEYYKHGLFNRINILLVNDNLIFAKNNLSKFQIDLVKQFQINQIISIAPQPIINIFLQDFNKSDYLKYSTASYIYGIIDNMYGVKSIGSVLIHLYIIFDIYVYLILIFIFIPSFIIFDSFYFPSEKKFSPYILIFFYTTSFGILNMLATSDISNVFTLILRSIPQTLLYIIFARYIFNLFVKKNI
ncbi:hypothetical protein B8063_05765 [Candidatus Pelagibacter sp. RS40]|nr:hypothetical protein B8063_05765 [Candidatus Pelagibacter sp. RS40]